MRSFGVRLHCLMRLALLVAVAATSSDAWARGVDILTFHGDTARLGWNRRETRLVPERVNSREFGKIWESRLDGQIYGSPLHVSELEIGGGKRDVVFTATQNNSVYALDAADGRLLWGPKTLAPALNEAQYSQRLTASAVSLRKG